MTLAANGVISGTPTANGTNSFTVKVTDALSATATKALSLTISLPFIYTNSAGTITITGYIGSGGAVIIPSQIGGLPVTSIGSNAFKACSSLTNLTIGTNVTSIGNQAFEYCTNLVSVTISNSVNSIGGGAFYDTGLTNVAIPSSVTSIGDGAFGDCTSLSAITVNSGNLFYSSANGVLFDKSQTTLIQFPAGWAGLYYVEYAIPDGVTGIGSSAFASCSNLYIVTIPSSVTNIGDYAFSSCPSLSAVYFLGNAPSAGTNVFLSDSPSLYYLPCASGWGLLFGGVPAVKQNWISFVPQFGPVYGLENTFYVTFPAVDNCGRSITTWIYLFGFLTGNVTRVISSNQGFSFTATSGGLNQVEVEVFSGTNDIGERIYLPITPLGFGFTFSAPELVVNGDFGTGDFTSWRLSGDTSWTFVGGGPQSGEFEGRVRSKIWKHLAHSAIFPKRCPLFREQVISSRFGWIILMAIWESLSCHGTERQTLMR